MNDTISLDGGGWHFAPDPFREGEALGWHQPGHEGMRQWPEVSVPAVFDRCAPGTAGYEGAGWFRRGFRLPAGWEGKHVFLSCGAVNYRARAWVNGVFVGENRDGFLPFEFAIPADALKTGGAENTLVIEADNTRHDGDVPGRQRGWRPYGGILRSVSLVARGALSLPAVRVLAGGDDALAGRASVHADVENAGGAAVTVRVSVEVRGPDGAVRGSAVSGPVSVPAGATERVTIALACEGVAPWSPDEPVLYRADVRLGDGEATADARTVRFGFRKVAVEGGRLTLNGQPVLLLGYNRHEDSPRTDMAADPELARRDLLRIKQGGANFVRLCHYPHDPSTLDLCDEIGLLVMAEIPLYWWQGHDGPGGESAFGRQYEAAVRQIDRLIDRDGHHPSVIAWSVSNETREDRPEVAEGNRRLVEYVRRRDHHRLAVHVSNHWERHPSFDADDLVCVNGYPYMRGRGWGEAEGEPFDSGEAGEWWRGALETLHARYPDKPILVTEFGHGAIEGAPEGAASESRQAQVVHDQLRNILAAGPWVCGAAVWCWADHAWAEDDWMNRLHVSPFGVVTRNRRAKLALDVLDKSFRASTGRPSLCLRRPDLENLPPLDLPEGYTLRIARDADADAIAAFMGRAFGEMTWTTANVREWLLDDETVKATFVIEHDGAPVATASARLLPEQYPGSGYVHWVGADVGHRGKRLGYLASLATLYEFARLGCKDAVLDTDDFRVPAIKVYLNLGFVPEHRHATHPVRWAKLAPKLEGYLPQ